MEVSIYVDGSVRPRNPGFGGAGLVAFREGYRIYEDAVPMGPGVTNNHAELYAIYLAAQIARRRLWTATIYSDSQWSIRVIEGSYRLKEARLVDLAGAIRDLLRGSGTFLMHVRGHQGIEGNEIAHDLADFAARQAEAAHAQDGPDGGRPGGR